MFRKKKGDLTKLRLGLSAEEKGDSSGEERERDKTGLHVS